MFIFFSRAGKPLGNLNYKTDHIELLRSSEFDLTDEEIRKMENGDYVTRTGQPVEPDVSPWWVWAITLILAALGTYILTVMFP